MNKDDAVRLAEYNSWATERIAAEVSTLSEEELERRFESSFPSIRETLAHLVGVAILWHDRWGGVSPRTIVGSGDLPRAAAGLVERWREADRAVLDFARTAPDPNQMVDIKNTSGQPFRHSLADMLQHLVTHQSYHRGQLTTLLRQAGRKPGRGAPWDQDFITFVRATPPR
jgi:uncharacterized damage-inducible protein DinB